MSKVDYNKWNNDEHAMNSEEANQPVEVQPNTAEYYIVTSFMMVASCFLCFAAIFLMKYVKRRINS
jgi:uncharacterized protein YgiM (DUF1202 family)